MPALLHTPYRMHLDHNIVIELLVMGAVAGFIAGLLGIGGGMVLVPFLTFIFSGRVASDSLAVKMAIATAMASIVFASLSSVRAHHKRGGVRFDIVKNMAPGIVLGAGIASLGVFSLLKGAYLAIFFGLFVGFSAWNMFKQKKIEAALKKKSGPLACFSIGASVGFLSGLVGAGGGFLNVPYLIRSGIGMRYAVGTSAALGFPIALANTIGFILSGYSVQDLPQHSLGYIYLPALFTLVLISIVFAPLGAKAAHVLPVEHLKRIFVWLLLGLAVYMFITGILEL